MEKLFHIGQMLTSYIERRFLKRKDICHKLGVPDSAIYSYEKRRSLQVLNLWNICHAMEYNFFADIANSLPETFDKGVFRKSPTEEIIERQDEEIKRLKWENELMKELVKGK